MLLAPDRSGSARRGAGGALNPARAGLAFDSDLGPLTLVEENGALTALEWRVASEGRPTGLLVEAKRALLAYLAGRRKIFELPLAPAGAEDERRVWAEMLKIPYGRTETYGAIARALGMNARQVGQACGRNPLPIIIPCHRVVAADGALTGYSGAGGLETKRKLLLLEGALLL